MPAIEFDIKPTNITSVGNRKNNGNRDSDIILYILIVVGASILLLLIPLVSYIVRWSKRKTRRRKRRRQAEKAHARRMAEKEILEQRMYEKQMSKTKPPPLELNNGTDDFEVPPRSPIDRENSPSASASSNLHPQSPVHSQVNNANEAKSTSDLNLSGFIKDNGVVNKGFHSSNSILSIPMRKSTSDMYLPRDPTLMHTAKRRFSEDYVSRVESPSLEEIQRKAFAQSSKEISKHEKIDINNKPKIEKAQQYTKEKVVGKEENDVDVQKEPEGARVDDTAKTAGNAVLKLRSPDSSKSSSIDSACELSRKTDTDQFDSDDDYDDVYDDIYENVDKNGDVTDEDGPIYDNINNSYDSDSDHIYSNVDELSDAESHIYSNIDCLYRDTKKSNGEGSEDDDYENIEFVYRNCGSCEHSTDADESESSSVSYENLDFLDGNENELEEDRNGEKDIDQPPLIIPRRIPILNGNNRKVDIVQNSAKIEATT